MSNFSLDFTESELTQEFLAAAIYSIDTDRKLNLLAEKHAKKIKFHFVDVDSGEPIPTATILEQIREGGELPTVKDTGCGAANDLLKSAVLLHLYGHEEQSKKTLKHALYMLYLHRGEGRMISNMLDSAKSVRQKVIAQKPRNPHHSEAIRIAKSTWQRYPGASKAQMCENLSRHFNGKVAIDTLDKWIKKASIQPSRPEKYTSFSLVLSTPGIAS